MIMEMEYSVKLVFIDEDEQQRELFGELLEECFTDFEIKTLEPEKTLENMTAGLVYIKPDVVVIDQKLKDTGVAKYFGIDLAVHLRGLWTDLPIYILTSQKDSNDFDGLDWSVEDIFSKNDLYSSRSKIVKRISRRVENHRSLRNEKEHQYHELLIKSLDEKNFTDKDELRFKELESELYSFDIIIEKAESAKLKSQLDKLDQIIGILKGI